MKWLGVGFLISQNDRWPSNFSFTVQLHQPQGLAKVLAQVGHSVQSVELWGGSGFKNKTSPGLGL